MSTKKFTRPKVGRVIGGVCAGLANYFNVDVTLVRVIAIILLLPGGLPAFLPYVILWIASPSE